MHIVLHSLLHSALHSPVPQTQAARRPKTHPFQGPSPSTPRFPKA